jgi:hypothetical protein
VVLNITLKYEIEELEMLLVLLVLEKEFKLVSTLLQMNILI